MYIYLCTTAIVKYCIILITYARTRQDYYIVWTSAVEPSRTRQWPPGMAPVTKFRPETSGRPGESAGERARLRRGPRSIHTSYKGFRMGRFWRTTEKNDKEPLNSRLYIRFKTKSNDLKLLPCIREHAPLLQSNVLGLKNLKTVPCRRYRFPDRPRQN